MTQETWDRAMVAAMITFALSVGAITLVALLLVLLREAEALAQAIATAGVGGTGLSLIKYLCRKGGK
jgi:hypothetical protein